MKSQKTVTFSEEVSVRVMYVYDFASRQARAGEWFKYKCQKISIVLNPIIFKF
mgnify:CR=1 FL=1